MVQYIYMYIYIALSWWFDTTWPSCSSTSDPEPARSWRICTMKPAVPTCFMTECHAMYALSSLKMQTIPQKTQKTCCEEISVQQTLWNWVQLFCLPVGSASLRSNKLFTCSRRLSSSWAMPLAMQVASTVTCWLPCRICLQPKHAIFVWTAVEARSGAWPLYKIRGRPETQTW